MKNCNLLISRPKFHKIENYFMFNRHRKNLIQLTKICSTYFLPLKGSLSSLKYGFGIRDPRSEIQISRFREQKKTYPGSRGQKTRYRITDPDSQHWLLSAQLLVVFFKFVYSRLVHYYFQNGSREAYGRGAEHG